MDSEKHFYIERPWGKKYELTSAKQARGEMEPLLVMMTFRETQRKPARLADPIAISDESASRAGICVTEQSMEPSGASDVSVHKRS